MKRENMFLLLICLVGYVFPIGAYNFSFSNHTNRNLRIRIKLSPSVFQDWEQGDMGKELGPKDDPETRTVIFEVGGGKIGFCLSKIQFSSDDIPWTPAVVQWVEGEDGQAFDRMLKMAEGFADGVTDIAEVVVREKLNPETLKKIDKLKAKKERLESHVGTLADIINASPDELESMTRAELDKQVRERFIRPNMAKIKAGDAEIIAQQQKIKNILDDMALDDFGLSDEIEATIDTVKTSSRDAVSFATKEGSELVLAKKKDDAKALVPYNPYKKEREVNYKNTALRAAQQQQSFRISDIIHVIGNLIKYSWCKSLHFDVVEDDEGIKFLVKVGQ